MVCSLKRGDLLARYATLLLSHVVNVREGELLGVVPHVSDPHFCTLLETEAANRGVELVWLSPGNNDLVSRLVDENGAVLHILGGHWMDVPELRRFMTLGRRLERRWSIAVFPDQSWADRLFPGRAENLCLLEDVVFDILMLDVPDAVAAWEELDRRLRARAKALNEAKIRTVHVRGNSSFDVGLTLKAVWKGGRKTFTDGRLWWTNFPCGEVFTTPDLSLTEGVIRASAPLETGGQLIPEITLTFEQGLIVQANASAEGLPAFMAILDTDEGSRRLGEFALAGADSPCSKYDLFCHGIPDEKRSSHVGIGNGYPHCIEGYEGMTADELFSNGCNRSSVHIDVMWGGDGVVVTADLWDGRKVDLMTGSLWASWLG